MARIDVSEMPIEEVEVLLEKRGIHKDPELAAKVGHFPSHIFLCRMHM